MSFKKIHEKSPNGLSKNTTFDISIFYLLSVIGIKMPAFLPQQSKNIFYRFFKFQKEQKSEVHIHKNPLRGPCVAGSYCPRGTT